MPAPVPVTVVIATMDRRDNVLTTLDRLAALPERPPVVLVDNGGTATGPTKLSPHAIAQQFDRASSKLPMPPGLE